MRFNPMKKLIPSLEALNEFDGDINAVHLSIPLFIRLLEFARESAKTDAELHILTEKLTELCKDGDTVSMDIYDQLVPSGAEESLTFSDTKDAEIVITLKDSAESKAFCEGIEKFCKLAKHGGDIGLFAKTDENLDELFSAHDFSVKEVQYKKTE